jgi:hypothetical protein
MIDENIKDMVRHEIYLNKDVSNAIIKIAADQRTSMNEIIRQALKEYCQQITGA